MSPAIPMTGLTGRIRSLIQNRFSPGLSRLYARLGFVNRQQLTQTLQQLPNNNHELLLDHLTAQGVIKNCFRPEIGSLAEVEQFMISGRITADKIDALEVEGLASRQLNIENQAIVSKLGQNVYSGLYTVARFATTNETLGCVFSGGVLAAKIAGGVLGFGGALWFFGVPGLTSEFTPGLGLAVATAACVIATALNNKLPLHGFSGGVGKVARFASRKVAPILYGLDGIYMGGLIQQANLRVASVLDSIGLEGTVAFLGLLFLAGYTFVSKNTRAFDRSYGGQLDPGHKKTMRRFMRTLALSSLGEVHYIGTRLLLLSAASAYMLLNTLSTIGPWGLVPLALPLVGFGATAALRGRSDQTYASKKQADGLDHLKVFSPFWGVAAGGLAAAIGGVATGSWLMPIFYTTFYGSFATLFLSEMHGAFHSLNTNQGGMLTQRTSSKDLIGEQEKRDLLARHSRILAINPHTDTKEHSFGVFFSALINRKPGLSFVCMYDYPKAQMKDGKLPNRDNHRLETQVIAEVDRLQQQVFDRLYQGIAGRGLTEKYDQLTQNLRQLADYFDGSLRNHLDVLTLNKDWFIPRDEGPEFRRAIFQAMAIRAEEFRTQANRLEQQVAKNYISEENFYAQWSELLQCYDPQLVKKIVVARKSVAGDERKVRKVENVASGLILRGLTVYKGWFSESYGRPGGPQNSSRLPKEDWISGSWTQMPNPNFRYAAAAGTLEASKYIWIKADHVRTDLQEKNSDYLSTSTYIREVDNRPAANEGFAQGAGHIRIDVNGESRPVNEYYYVTGNDPLIIPAIKEVSLRDGVTRLPEGYQLATRNQPENADMDPLVFTPPAFDFSIMMDKNDVQVNTTTLLPALLERAKRDMYLHLILRQPIKKFIVFNETYEFVNPHHDKEIDHSAGLQLTETTIELSYTDRQGHEHIIPYKVDRGAVTAGVDESAPWKGLSRARVIRKRRQPTYFGLIFRGIEWKAFGEFRDYKQHQIWGALHKAGYLGEKEGTFSIVQPKFDGLRDSFSLNLKLKDKELDRIFEILQDHIKEVAMPQSDHPNYLASLELPASGDFILSANNFLRNPHREGDMAFVKIYYTDGTVAFARTADGKRPMLNNKDMYDQHGRPL